MGRDKSTFGSLMTCVWRAVSEALFILTPMRGRGRGDHPRGGRGGGGRGESGRGGRGADRAQAAAMERLALVEQLSKMGLSTSEAVAAVRASPNGSTAEQILKSQRDEKRRASDGIFYTQSEFQQYFGGLAEWHAAAPASVPAACAAPTAAAPSPERQQRQQQQQQQAVSQAKPQVQPSSRKPRTQDVAVEQRDATERRQAPDGQSYTMAEFKAFFGGLKEWHDASKAAQNAVQTPEASRAPAKKSGESNAKSKAASQAPSHGSTADVPVASKHPYNKRSAAKRHTSGDEFPTAPPLRSNGDVTVLHVAEKPLDCRRGDCRGLVWLERQKWAAR